MPRLAGEGSNKLCSLQETSCTPRGRNFPVVHEQRPRVSLGPSQPKTVFNVFIATTLFHDRIARHHHIMLGLQWLRHRR